MRLDADRYKGVMKGYIIASSRQRPLLSLRLSTRPLANSTRRVSLLASPIRPLDSAPSRPDHFPRIPIRNMSNRPKVTKENPVS